MGGVVCEEVRDNVAGEIETHVSAVVGVVVVRAERHAFVRGGVAPGTRGAGRQADTRSGVRVRANEAGL